MPGQLSREAQVYGQLYKFASDRKHLDLLVENALIPLCSREELVLSGIDLNESEAYKALNPLLIEQTPSR